MTNKDILSFLEREKWYPAVKPTEAEMIASKLLNDIIDRLINKINND